MKLTETSSEQRATFLTWLRWLLAIAIVLLVGWQLIEVSDRLDTATFWKGVKQPENLWKIVLVLLLMPVNWLLETLKWRQLLYPFHRWSFLKCLGAVLAGVSVSAITPNRIGEIGGRLLVVKKEEVAGVIASSLLGSVCQWLVFLIVALPCLLWVIGPFLQEEWQLLRWLGIPVGLGIVVLALWGGSNFLAQIVGWLGRRFNRSFAELESSLLQVGTATLLISTAYAGLRFLTYVTQLYLLLGVFGVSLPLFNGLAGIAAIYFVQAGIPLPPGINLLTRAELGVFLWGNSPEVVAGSLAAFSGLFLVNILLPALPAHLLIVKKA